MTTRRIMIALDIEGDSGEALTVIDDLLDAGAIQDVITQGTGTPRIAQVSCNYPEHYAKPTTLATLELAANEVATELMENKIAPCHRDAGSCIREEETRPLTREEERKGWSRRPFNAYDTGNLCTSCAAYWHASMVQILIQNEARYQAAKARGK